MKKQNGKRIRHQQIERIEDYEKFDEIFDSSLHQKDDLIDEYDDENVDGLSALVNDALTKKTKSKVYEFEDMDDDECCAVADDDITVGDILDHMNNGGVKDQLIRLRDNTKPLAPRLSSVKQAKIERKLNYDQCKKQINKYSRQTQRMRFQEEVVFGEAPDHMPVLLEEISEHFEAQTKFEKDMAKAIQESGLTEEAAEDTGSLPMTGEVKDSMQNRDRAKVKELLFREQQRFARLKKIKSRVYRKIHRKSENIEREKLLIRLEKDNPELANQLRQDYEKKRAEIRSMTKQSARQKWAKMASRYGGKDMQKTISEQAQSQHDERRAVERIVKRKPNFEDDSQSEDEELESSDEEKENPRGSDLKAKLLTLRSLQQSDDPIPDKGIFGLKFMQNAIVDQRKQQKLDALDVLDALENDEIPFDTEKKPKYVPDELPVYSQKELEDAENNLLSNSTVSNGHVIDIKKNNLSVVVTGPVTVKTAEEIVKQPKKSNEIPEIISKNKETKKTKKKTKLNPKSDDLAVSFVGENTISKDTVNEDEMFRGLELDKKDTSLIREAFISGGTQEEDWNNEMREKERLERRDNEETIVDGWGSWTGCGLKKIVKVEEEPPVKAYPRVQINLKKDEEFFNEHLVDALPFGVGNQKQYQSSLIHPLGPEWNTNAIHKRLIKPQVNTRIGAVITPLNYIRKLPKEEADSVLSFWKDGKQNKDKGRSKTRL
eukprot:GHVL01035651.1.p1 GENE.GHVL01035651.1~~GHVL01035651.1.p1  ORF type:complete len:716 (-),score=176.72 GHVL01035651.1:40-2187(-)